MKRLSVIGILLILFPLSTWAGNVAPGSPPYTLTARKVVQVFNSGSCTGFLYSDGTCNEAVTTESDPAAGAVNGIVKSNGASSFSSATASDLPIAEIVGMTADNVQAGIAENNSAINNKRPSFLSDEACFYYGATAPDAGKEAEYSAIGCNHIIWVDSNDTSGTARIYLGYNDATALEGGQPASATNKGYMALTEDGKLYVSTGSSWVQTSSSGSIGSSSDTQILFNSSDTVAGDAGLTYNASIDTLYSSTDSGASSERGVVIEQHNDAVSAATLIGKKSRGTKSSPTTIANGDYPFVMYARAHDGSTYVNGGYAGWLVDGTVSTGVVPTDFVVATVNSSGTQQVNFKVTNDRKVNVPGLAGSYINSSAFVCTNNSGDLYASESACP